MAQDITATMDGTLLNWLKDVGDAVSSGDIIAEMDADKATVEVEAPGDGVLIAQSVQPGDSISEGAVIGQIGNEGEAPAGANGANGKQPAAEEAPQAETEAEEPEAAEEQPAAATNGTQQAATTADGRIKASPLAKRIAEDKGINLSQVKGSGPGGRIVKADVENFQPGEAPAKAAPAAEGAPLATPQRTPPPESETVEHIEISNMRKRIAATTIESQQTIPHFYITTEIDVAAMLKLRKQLNDSVPEDGTRISVNDMVVKATALILRDFPNLNSHFYGDRIVRYKQINVGIAVATPNGGVIYVVARDADKVALGTMAAENKAMALRAREGKMKPADFQGATFSTSNLGAYGVDHFAAVINPPEAGVLAFGTAKTVPVVKEDGTLGTGDRMNVTLSVDHRISDGAEGAEYLQAFKELLENPMRLLI